ncbi:MAG: FxsA family protein [Deltaproteobacteria bacterium]|nr:MAG: FxsA family protein [Deltaproteobacteria bacterium]
MFFKLLLIFTLVPLIELYLLIKIGVHFGAANTILLVVGTGVVGAYLAKMQGIRTVNKIRSNLSEGILPAEEMIDALLIFIAGVVLLTPGVITDLCGLLILIPSTRLLFKRWLRRQFDRMITSRTVSVHMDGWH